MRRGVDRRRHDENEDEEEMVRVWRMHGVCVWCMHMAYGHGVCMVCAMMMMKREKRNEDEEELTMKKIKKN